MRIGLLGGTFNPPHVGHLICAQEALVGLGLDRVWLVPVATPPHKVAVGDPGPGVRVELCRLAVGEDRRFDVSTLEVDAGGRSYTVDTLASLHASHPEHEWTFLMGADQAVALSAWRDPQGVVARARLGVAERSGTSRAAVRSTLDRYPGADVAFFAMPRVDVSSTLVRARVAAGAPIRYLVPHAVERAIAAGGLYRAPVAS